MQAINVIAYAYCLWYINNTIVFDNKYWLYGFNNIVYDLKIHNFRNYKFDDYVSITTNYDWRDNTNKESKK